MEHIVHIWNYLDSIPSNDVRWFGLAILLWLGWFGTGASGVR